jgi:hypothetical protein
MKRASRAAPITKAVVLPIGPQQVVSPNNAKEQAEVEAGAEVLELEDDVEAVADAGVGTACVSPGIMPGVEDAGVGVEATGV